MNGKQFESEIHVRENLFHNICITLIEMCGMSSKRVSTNTNAVYNKQDVIKFEMGMDKSRDVGGVRRGNSICKRGVCMIYGFRGGNFVTRNGEKLYPVVHLWV